ncbi:yippee [Trichophyton equinum CBS 127.97]|uniref:Protein yippee-like n=1 Tax=Trichophyton equinum (strain ATCC MYA-4606 / CBS 127.97) TaxID=559882 RepID=F2PKN6_TRIEC|nr:yippee [Trichophyton equinum CBS 127.97]
MGLSYNIYINSNKIFGCKHCKTHLADYHDIISRVGYLAHSLPPHTPLPPPHMFNCKHVVRDIHCTQCNETVGWKYDKAYETSEKYKEGKFILEAELLSVVY